MISSFKEVARVQVIAEVKIYKCTCKTRLFSVVMNLLCVAGTNPGAQLIRLLIGLIVPEKG